MKQTLSEPQYGMRRTLTSIDKIRALQQKDSKLLKKAFTEDAMTPGQTAGVNDATAERWYEKWAEGIRRSLESKLLASLEESVKRHRKKRPK